MSLYVFVLVTLGLHAVTSITVPLVTTTKPRVLIKPLVTPTSRLTTTPAGSCEYKGKMYMDGQDIDTRCEILVCESGAVITYGKVNCYLDYHPYLCNGVLVQIPGKCCAFCNETTAVPLTTPSPPTTTFPSDICVEGWEFFLDGEEISRSVDSCTGTICQSGQIIHWYNPCVIDPPFCPGTEEKLPDQCCPLCHVTKPPEKTTLPKTTTQ